MARLIPGAHAARLRKEFGAWLQRKREAAGVTQLEVAKLAGFPYHTTISQIERGFTALPSQRYNEYAKAIKVKPEELAKRALRFYDPPAYEAIFGRPGRTDDD